MNRGVYANTGVKPSSTEYATWKYYMNLSGDLHPTNTQDMVIKLVETGEIVSFNKPTSPTGIDYLDAYPATRAALDKRTNLYMSYIDKYPDDVLYINGRINPVDRQTAIDAKNGDIISYSDIYIEQQEYSIIRELSSCTRDFFNRWYIEEYNICDELYMAGVLGVLYSNIPNMIATIRLRDASTAEAHSFHIEHFFRSHLNLWHSVKVLDQQTIRWLYKNLVTLMNNVGLEETFQTLINKILIPNGVGLARYNLIKTPLSLTTNPSYNEPSFTTNKPKMIAKELTPGYIDSTYDKTVNNVVTKEILSTPHQVIPTAEALVQYESTVVDTIPLDIKLNQPTKILDFGKVELFKTYSNNLIETILDVWLTKSHYGHYNFRTNFIDPITKDIYSLTAYDGILLFYYLLFRKLGTPNPRVDVIRSVNRLKLNISRNSLTSGLIHTNGNTHAANMILDGISKIAKLGRTRQPTGFATVIDAYIKLYSDVWIMDSNVNNSMLSPNIKKMCSRLFITDNITVASPGVDLITVLKNNGININIPNNYNYDVVLTELFKVFTGLELHEETALLNTYVAYKDIITKLTSYTTQILNPEIPLSDITVPYTTIAVANASQGIIEVTASSIIKVIEDNKTSITGIGNDYIDEQEVAPMNAPTVYADRLNRLSLAVDVLPHTKDEISVTVGRNYGEVIRKDYIEFGPETIILGATDDRITDIAAEFFNTHLQATDESNRNDLYIKSIYGHVNYSAYAEILRMDHSKFIPNVIAGGNNEIKKALIKTRIADPKHGMYESNLVSSITHAHKLVTNSSQPVYAEVVRPGHDKFIPSVIAAGNDNRDITANTDVTNKINTGYDNTIIGNTTHAHKLISSVTRSAYAEVIRTGHTAFIPSVIAAGNDNRVITVNTDINNYTRNSYDNNPIGNTTFIHKLVSGVTRSAYAEVVRPGHLSFVPQTQYTASNNVSISKAVIDKSNNMTVSVSSGPANIGVHVKQSNSPQVKYSTYGEVLP
jgi:hypothetical protein